MVKETSGLAVKPSLRLGVDVGGTKIEVAVLNRDGTERLRHRTPAPGADYDSAVQVLAARIVAAEREAGEPCSVGIGMPGEVSRDSALVANAYNTPFNGRPLKRDLEHHLAREVRFANDANCFALSEALDGAARGARVVFGAILGTGVGGGLVLDGRVHDGRNGIAGEWGHTPLPWMTESEYPGPLCKCGRRGCIEQFLSGPAKNRDRDTLGEDAAMALYEDRLARAFAMLIDVVDPDVIVIGGGLSKHERLYRNVAPLLPKYVYCEHPRTAIVQAAHGDASGVRGAAMLWPAS
jgi:fructokinase